MESLENNIKSLENNYKESIVILEFLKSQSLNQVPSRRIVVRVNKGLLTFIIAQNKEFGTEDWIIERWRARDNGEGKDLWIRICSECIRTYYITVIGCDVNVHHIL